jgi:hypothetical protein
MLREMKNGTRGMPQWRKPSLCECGERMTLTLVHDCYVLLCHRCGASGKASVPSLNVHLADKVIA